MFKKLFLMWAVSKTFLFFIISDTLIVSGLLTNTAWNDKKP